jgi:hypothetical protein
MKSSIPSRGLQDIHTMTERISSVDNPQKKYLSLAMLELEKARRNKEKQSATQRVTNINQRIADIQAEQQELLAVAENEMDTLASDKSCFETKTTDGMSSGSIKLTY